MKKMSILAVTVLLLGLVLFLARCGSSSSGGDSPMWMFNTRLSAIGSTVTPTRLWILTVPIAGTDIPDPDLVLRELSGKPEKSRRTEV